MNLKYIENQGLDLELINELGKNIEIIELGNKFDFKEFIDNTELNTIAVMREGSKYNVKKYLYFNVYYKVEIVKGIYQIFKQTHNANPIITLLDVNARDFSRSKMGFYSTYENCFCLKSYYNMDDMVDIELKDVNCIGYHDFIESINEGVNASILNINLSKEDDVKYNKYIDEDFMKICKLSAKELLIKDNEYCNGYYPKYNIRIGNASDIDYLKFLQALHDKNNLIKKEYENFINDDENRKSIYRAINRKIYINKYIEELKNDEEIIKLRELYKVLKDKTKKTLNLTYTKNNETMQFKIKGNPSINDFKGIYSHSIIDKRDEKLFEKKFTDDWRTRDILFECIDEITYGRRVLYQK